MIAAILPREGDMAKCPYCGEQLTEIADGVMSCAKCKKKFRKRTATPATAQEPVPMPVREAPKAPAQATPTVPAAVRETRPVPAPSPIPAPTPAPAETPKAGSAAEQEELAMLRARIAAMEAKQAELERGSVPKKREGGAGAAVISFAKKWGLKAVLPAVLVLIALITLLVCFCGVRGIYVNIDDPNEFYSFDATSYEYHGIFMGEEYVDEGTWKKSGGQLLLTYRDEDFGKVTESYDFSSLNSNKTLFISDDFGNKGEFKRVSLLAYGTSQKIKITLDGNGGSGGDSHKVQIGSKIQEPAEPTRDGYMFMGWYTSKEGWKNAEAKRIDFDDRVWEDVTYYANWKNTTQFDLTGDGLDEPVKFTEGDDVESLYMSARGWNSLPDGVTGLIFKDASGNEIDPSSPPLDNIHVTVVYDVRIVNGILLYVTPALKEYTIPASVTEIASGAFDGCTELETIHIASRSSALTVQEGAFDECEKLSLVAGYADSTAMRSVLEASGVTRAHITAGTIASSAFDGCTTLTSVTIGDGVTSIGSYAFNDCTSLTSVTIPDSVTSIGNDAFNGCSAITSATMPSHAIGDIPRDSLKTVVITSGDRIGDYAFDDCTSLTSVTIGNGVTSIGYGAFRDCTSLTSVTIGNSVTRIANYTFEGCGSLGSVYIADIGKWAEINFGNLYANPLYYAGNLYLNGELVTGELIIPDGVTSIGRYAFYGYDRLTSITIPDGVTSIGSSAFEGCTSLATIIIPDNVTSIGGYTFRGCTSLTSVTIGNSVTSIGDYAFYNCGSLSAVTIGNGVTSIGDYAFYGCDSLTSVTIPDSVTSIGSSAFSGCTNIASAIMPSHAIGDIPRDNLKTVVITSGDSIGYGAFEDCTSLTSVTIPDSVTSIGWSAFENCTSLTSITIPDGVPSIGDYTFRGCTSLTSVTIPDSVTSIGIYAFYGCDNLRYNEYGNALYLGNDENPYVVLIKTKDKSITSVDIYDSTKVIYGFAFRDCTSLTSVTIPDSVTSIGDYAFDSCDALTSVTIPDSVTSIGQSAFAHCTSLTSVTIPDSVTSIRYEAFRNCTSLTSVTIPDGVTSIGNYAFYNCTSLTSVIIPSSVTSIGREAFHNCSSLASVTIPDGVTSIGYRAFEDCTSLTSVTFNGTMAEWGAVDKDPRWHNYCPFSEVVCSDGSVSV